MNKDEQKVLTNLQNALKCVSCSGTCSKVVNSKQVNSCNFEHTASVSSPVELQSTKSISSKSLVKQYMRYVLYLFRCSGNHVYWLTVKCRPTWCKSV